MESTKIFRAVQPPGQGEPPAGDTVRSSIPALTAESRAGGEPPAACVEALVAGGPQRFPLDGVGVCRIGRGDQNTIVLADDLASRQHAMIQQSEAGEYQLIDLGSRNGTQVNSRRVTTPLILQSGDRITIGRHEFVFHQQKKPGSAAAEPAMAAGTSTHVALNLRLITVLVTDIRDFTGLARRLDEATLAQTIGTFLRRSGAALLEQRAWAQKYIGDAVMAVWLHQEATPALQELLAVFEGFARLNRIAGNLQSQFALDAPIRIGGGINTGIASTGNVGSEAFADHTALGDVVNKTFRLESATKEIHSDLALGQRTYEYLARIPGVAELFERHMVKLKGYQEPAPAYALSLASLERLVAVLRSAIAGEAAAATA